MLTRHRFYLFILLLGLGLVWALFRPWGALGGTVQVTNSAPVPVQIVDSAAGALANLEAGATATVAMPDGDRALRAITPDGSVYSAVVIRVGAKGSPRWEILNNQATLEVRNRSGAAVTIVVDDQPLGECPSLATLRLESLRPGLRELRAISEGETVATVAAQLTPGDVYVWRLDPLGITGAGVSLLRVSNFSGGPVDVFVAGLKRVRVQPGDSAAMVGIPEGDVTVEARRPDGARVDSAVLAFGPETLHRWMVTGADGGRAVVEVVNDGPRAIKVCVDGSYCLRVGAYARIQYDEVTPGPHSFQAYDLLAGTLLQTGDLEATVGTPFRWVVSAP